MAFPLTLEEVVLSVPRAWAEIDLNAIRHNVQALRRHIAPSEVTAVVKANGYGLGAIPIARAALSAGAVGLAVSSCEEGQELRAAGLAGPILVLGFVPVELAPLCVQTRLTLTVNTPELAQALSRAAVRLGRDSVPVHLKLDTGLHRYGLDAEAALALARLIAGLPGLQLQGLYTHFASGDESDRSFVHEQHRRFIAARELLAAQGFHFPQQHLSNSASAITVPQVRASYMRAGLSLYGYYPTPGVETVARRERLLLRPAFSLKSTVVRLSTLPAGESVGYNRTFVAQEERQLALVPIGYADGYPRALSNRAYALVGGCRVPVVGRVSMDQITLDVTGVAGLQQGNEVVLIGPQGEECVTLEEIATLCDTIPYEILTGLGRRVARIYPG